MQCYERTSTTKSGTDFNHTSFHRMVDTSTCYPPPVSSPIHPRNQIQLQIYIKSIVLSVSWMRNKGGYKGLPIAKCVHSNKTYIEKKKDNVPWAQEKKKVEHSTKLKQVGIVTCPWLIFFFLANVNLIS